MRDRVDDDVREVVVGKPVQHFAAGSLSGDHTGRLEDLQMLADQRLRHAQRVDQFVHAALGFAQLQHDGDPHRRGQRAQQFAGGVENLPRRRRGVVGEVGEHRRRRARETNQVVIGGTYGVVGDVSVEETSPLESSSIRTVRDLPMDTSPRLPSTVTCMMTHVKDRGADRYHD